MDRTRIAINADVLLWARSRARLAPSGVASRVGVSLETYERWERGDLKPTLRQFFDLVRVLSQPSQVFFLQHPPEEVEPIAQLRRLPGTTGVESPELVLQVNLASRRREAALALFSDMGEEPPVFDLTATTDDDPDAVGLKVREAIGVAVEEQASWDSSGAALKVWRRALEEVGVLAFQAPGVALAEMRGFCLPSRPLPVVVLNSADTENGRIFTLFHELAHIVLGDAVLDSGAAFDPSRPRSEVFCDRVAAAALMPRSDLLRYVEAMEAYVSREWTDLQVQQVARRYRTSGAVAIRRLRALDLVSKRSYESLRPVYDSYRARRQRSSGGDPYATLLSRLGWLLPKLAFNAYYSERLCTSDLSGLFGLQTKHLGKLEAKLYGSNYGLVA